MPIVANVNIVSRLGMKMNKKILALILTITLPIWFIPAFFVFLAYTIFVGAYEGILEALNGKAQEK